MHLHAPVPVPYGLPHVANPSRQIHTPYVEQTYYGHHVPYPPFLNQTPGPTTTNTNILDYYANAPQLLLPTPSELPTDLSILFAQIPTTLSSSLFYPTQHEQSQSSERSNEPLTSAAPNTNKTESRRGALQRTVAEEIAIFYSDTISSHEKRRQYLECLEHYVLYLHEQLRLVNNTPPLDLKRVSTYLGLSSRSIRTLLVHMQNTNHCLHENMLKVLQ
ncbi:uncharacterized protein HD556DRAFT_1227116 [Suillus plorans]|uniref:Uncharacterized protein n=1 Tax=Suillus plorans TaxID=116603 RepID=A0A9P7DV23_9AGAM|nr:uncharacterized protein HD556DRAFT_1227116 [Suillus plorans]KAG1803892.1 hypothetical protein HD556DRAFT_1227116 [Suillus plorans]